MYPGGHPGGYPQQGFPGHGQYAPQGYPQQQQHPGQYQQPAPQQGGGQQQQQQYSGPIWMFEVKQGVWQPVMQSDNKAMEDAFQANPHGAPVVPLYGGGREAVQYQLNFQTMQRINVGTNSTRAMKRVTAQELQSMPQDSIIPPPVPAQQGEVKVQWLFKEGDQVVPLHQQDSDNIESVYQRNKNGSGTVNIQGSDYTLNFSDWTRTSAHAPQPAPIARANPTEFPPVQPVPQGLSWYFQDDNKCWLQFAPEDADVVEKQYKTGQNGVVSLRGIQYELDFQKWVRINTQSKSVRNIRRHQG